MPKLSFLKLHTFFTLLLLIICCSTAADALAQSPRLEVGSTSGLPGATVTVPVFFTAGGTGVSTLQFELQFSSPLSYVSCDTGTAASAAGKSVSANAVSGGLRVLIFGLNQTIIGSGAVANVHLGISGSAMPGQAAVAIANIVASTPSAAGVTTQGTAGGIQILAPSDTTPPTISGISSSGITQTSAVIRWTTNENSDSQVEYGTSTAYGSSTAIDTALRTSHSQTLSGLTAGVQYHYRVRSRDAAGNLAISSDRTFTTAAASDTTPPVISGVSSSGVTANRAVITWNTNENADTQVEYGTSTAYGSSTALISTLSLSHSQTISGLNANTQYHYRVKSRDAAGNLAVSGDYTFSTASAADNTPPVISSVAASGITRNSATITWATNEAADSQVEYGKTTAYGSSTGLQAALTTSHAQTLSGLSPGSEYHFRVKSKDQSGNLSVSADYTFTTTQDADTAAPVISAVGSSNVTQNAATISWTTNEAADSQVEYGTTTSYGSSTALNAALTTSHLQTITGLREGVEYHYRVKSKDAAGNLAVSSDFTFTTKRAADTAAPVISDVRSLNVTGNSARISWATNEAADSQVEYGPTPAYGSTTAIAAGLTQLHTMELTGLASNKLYHYRVKSKDAAGNLAVSGNFTFRTTSEPDTAAPVISEVTSSRIKKNSATISWVTNEPADTQVEYGLTTAYGSFTTLNRGLGTSHLQTLSHLNPDTVYHYRVRSKDAAGNLAMSADYTFKTSQSGTTPVIRDITVSDIKHNRATISWTTDKPADSVIEYWPAGRPQQVAALGEFVTQHSITLKKLDRQTNYGFRIRSSDPEGNQAGTFDLTFTTLSHGDSVAALPRFTLARSQQAGGTLAAEEEDIMTGWALANLGSQPASLTFTAVDSSGNLIEGNGIENPSVRRLAPHNHLSAVDFQIFGDGFAKADSKGWIKMESSSLDVSGFFLTFDSGLSLMDGTNFGDAPMTDFAFTEIEPNGTTWINIANENSEDAEVTIDLMAADGTVRSSKTRTVPANGALVANLYVDLFNGIDSDPADYVRVQSTLGVRSFELMQKTVGDFSSLTGHDFSAGGTKLYSAQYVQGGPWKTSLSVLNLDSRPGMVTFRFLNPEGKQIGTTRALAIAAHGKIYIDDPSFFTELDLTQTNGGYLEIESDGVRLTGSTIFGDVNDQSFSSALPLIYNYHESVLFSHVASNTEYFTGIAILNPSQVDAEVIIELHDANGIVICSTNQPLPAGQRVSKVLTEYFPSIARQSPTGYVRLRATQPIVSFAVFGTNNLSVLSALPPQDAR